MKKIIALCLLFFHSFSHPLDFYDRVMIAATSALAVIYSAAYMSCRKSNEDIISNANHACFCWEKATGMVELVDDDQSSDKRKQILKRTTEFLNVDFKRALEVPKTVTELSAGLQQSSREVEDRFAIWCFWNRDERVNPLKTRLNNNLDRSIEINKNLQHCGPELKSIETAAKASKPI